MNELVKSKPSFWKTFGGIGKPKRTNSPAADDSLSRREYAEYRGNGLIDVSFVCGVTRFAKDDNI